MSEDEEKLISRWHGKCLQGRGPLGLARLVSGPTFYPPPFPRFPGCKLRSYHVCKVLTYNHLLSFGQKSPQIPIRVRSWRSALWSSTRWLCVGVRPVAHPTPQPSTGGAVMTASGGGVGVEDPCCSEVCLPPNVGHTPSHPAACFSVCNSTIRVTSFGLRQRVLNCALREPPRNPQSPSGAGEAGVTGDRAPDSP